MKKLFSLFFILSFLLGTVSAQAACEEQYINEIGRIQRSLDLWYGGFGFSNYYRPHYYQPTVVIHVDSSHNNNSNKNTSAAEVIIILALVAIPTTHIIIMADRMDGIDDILGLMQNSREYLASGFTGKELSRMTRRVFGKDQITPENLKLVAETALKLNDQNKFCNGEIARDLEMRTVVSGISSRNRLLARYIEVKRAIEREVKLTQPVF